MSNIIKGEQAIKGMMAGVELAVELIRPTYGGHGTNVVIESRLRPGHLIANDAWTIIKDIKAKDPAERVGLEFVKELCEKQDKLSGDSRKTTIILLSEILKAGYEADINKLQLKRDLDALIPVIEAEIDKQTKPITVDDVKNVASTAGESEEIGALIQEIYQKIGKDGIIQPEGSGTYETSYRFIDGVRFDMAGFLSPYMVHDEQAVKDKVKETKAVYENPLILVTKKKIASDEDINPRLREMEMQGSKDLVIFTSDMDSGVASMLIGLHQSKRFNILIIKAPILWRDYIYEDFAKCTGATIIEDATGKTFKNMHLTDLGTCGKIVTDADETIIIGTKDITEHIDSLKAKGDNDSKLRLSWLTNKTAILRLGANSETDLSYKRLKTADAIRSSELALKYGVVQGGGRCLWSIANDKTNELWKSKAGQILTIALNAPLVQIMDNMGLRYENYHPSESVTDASMVVKNAVRNAIGIASTILTANGLVYLPEEEKKPAEVNPFG